MRYRYKRIPEPVRPLTEDDYAWMHAALTWAVSQVRCPRGRRQQSFDGQVYTYVRQKAFAERNHPNDPILRLFGGRKKNLEFSFLKEQEKERLELMFTNLKQQHLKTEDNDTTFQELENLLAGMRASTQAMAHVATESEKVKSGIEELERFLEN